MMCMSESTNRRPSFMISSCEGAGSPLGCAVARTISASGGESSGAEFLMVSLGRFRHDRRCGCEDLLAITGQRRINPLAVDQLLRLLRRCALRDDMTIPPSV